MASRLIEITEEQLGKLLFNARFGYSIEDAEMSIADRPVIWKSSRSGNSIVEWECPFGGDEPRQAVYRYRGEKTEKGYRYEFVEWVKDEQ